jgi:hypothetical protein
MEHEGSLPSSQELSTCTYPEPGQSSPQHSILSLKGSFFKSMIQLQGHHSVGTFKPAENTHEGIRIEPEPSGFSMVPQTTTSPSVSSNTLGNKRVK